MSFFADLDNDVLKMNYAARWAPAAKASSESFENYTSEASTSEAIAAAAAKKKLLPQTTDSDWAPPAKSSKCCDEKPFEMSCSDEVPMEIDDYDFMFEYEAAVKNEASMKNQTPTASKLLDGVADELECAICNDLLRRPKYLQCMHTFCEECLVNLAISRKGMAMLPCPLCRKMTPNPTKKGIRKGLKTNLIVERIIERLQKDGKLEAFREPEEEDARKVVYECPTTPQDQNHNDTLKMYGEFPSKHNYWFKTQQKDV